MTITLHSKSPKISWLDLAGTYPFRKCPPFPGIIDRFEKQAIGDASMRETYAAACAAWQQERMGGSFRGIVCDMFGKIPF